MTPKFRTRLLTAEQAAGLLQEAGLIDFNRKMINDWIDRGKIPAIIVGRRRRVRQDFLEKLINEWIAEAGNGGSR
jgi:hypothetical protein